MLDVLNVGMLFIVMEYINVLVYVLCNVLFYFTFTTDQAETCDL